MQLHHLAIGATDVAGLARFYEAAFGLEHLREHRRDDGRLRSVWLRLAGGVLMVEEIETGSRPRLPETQPEAGWFLLSFAATDPSERDACCSRAIALGARESHRTAFTCYLLDPEGNRVAVSCYPLQD